MKYAVTLKKQFKGPSRRRGGVELRAGMTIVVDSQNKEIDLEAIKADEWFTVAEHTEEAPAQEAPVVAEEAPVEEAPAPTPVKKNR